ncbi:MAG: hypothetical protein JW810_13065 [Sedimentisphaerales bacterium]|nr:hypothetical protein [Sedimentisphaerales bacterium]
MSPKEYSPYQQDVIRRYYQNLDAIKLQELQELVTELFLADNDRRREKLWQRVQKALQKLAVPPGLREHILQRRSAEVLAENLRDWLRRANRRR